MLPNNPSFPQSITNWDGTTFHLFNSHFSSPCVNPLLTSLPTYPYCFSYYISESLYVLKKTVFFNILWLVRVFLNYHLSFDSIFNAVCQTKVFEFYLQLTSFLLISKFWVIFTKASPNPRSQKHSSMFSCHSLIVSFFYI